MGRKRLNPQDIVGKTQGKLTVLEFLRYVEPKSGGKPYYLYKTECECGNTENTKRGHIAQGKKSCNECAQKKRYRALQRAHNGKDLIFVPNFTMRAYIK